MKKYSPAFTLVELIVVITILAILGSIAFISLQGYSQTAKNSKIAQDIKTLSSAIEIGITSGKIWVLSWLVTGDVSTLNWVAPTSIVTMYNDKNEAITWVLDNTSVEYLIGQVNFQTLRQNGDDFKDTDGNNYIIATALSGSTAYYQLAWQQRANSWEYIAIIKWNYSPRIWDTAWLISARWSQTPIANGANLGTQAKNTNFY